MNTRVIQMYQRNSNDQRPVEQQRHQDSSNGGGTNSNDPQNKGSSPLKVALIIAAYDSYLKALNLLLEIVLRDDHLHDLRLSPQVEDILGKLEAYELPLDTRRLLFQYDEQRRAY